MLEKGVIYNNDLGNNIELIDYFYYKGSKEHSFQLSVNGKIEKHIIEDNKINIFLNKFKTKNQMDEPKKSLYREMQENLLETMKEVKAGTLDTQKAFAISKLSDSFINSVKVESFARINKVYPEVIK